MSNFLFCSVWPLVPLGGISAFPNGAAFLFAGRGAGREKCFLVARPPLKVCRWRGTSFRRHSPHYYLGGIGGRSDKVRSWGNLASVAAKKEARYTSAAGLFDLRKFT